MPLKYRVLTIVALCLASLWALFPRNVTQRERDANGVMHDTTVRHGLRSRDTLRSSVMMILS